MLPEHRPGAVILNRLWPLLALDGRRRRDRLPLPAGARGGLRLRDHLVAGVAAPGRGRPRRRGARRRDLLRRAHLADPADRSSCARRACAARCRRSRRSTERPERRRGRDPHRLAGVDGRPARRRRRARGGARARRRRRRGRRGRGAPREVRTLALTDLVVGARRARGGARAGSPSTARARVVYATVTAALLWPRPGAIRFDAPAAANRPGRHGALAAPARAPAPARGAAAGAPGAGDAGRVALAARARGRRADPRRAVGAAPAPPPRHRRDHLRGQPARRRASTACSPRGRARAARTRSWWSPAPSACPRATGVRATGPLEPARVPRAAAPRARLRHRPAARGLRRRAARGAGRRLPARDDARARPYAALPLARALDPRLVGDDLAPALRAALDDPPPGYAERALAASRPTAAPPSTPSCASAAACSRARRGRVAETVSRLSGRACAAARTPPTGACWRPRPPSARRAARWRCP